MHFETTKKAVGQNLLDSENVDALSPIPETADGTSPMKTNTGTGRESNAKENLLKQSESMVSEDHKKDTVNDNLNVRAAVIHILGDMVQSIGVISAAIIIKFKPEWQEADPICTFLFSILVLLTTVPIFCECLHIIMENTPDDIDVKDMYNDILKLKTVEEVHDFHCWSLAGGKHIMTIHIRSNFGDKAIRHVNKICARYGVFHTTVQVEKENRGSN